MQERGLPLEEEVQALSLSLEPFVQTKIIGHSLLGRPIYAIKLGGGPDCILLQGAHHAREWPTARVLMRMLRLYAWSAFERKELAGFDVARVIGRCGIWFVPLVNVDGVALARQGLEAIPEDHREQVLELNNGSDDFRRWKANIRGVDLNLQYPARWDQLPGFYDMPRWAYYPGSEPLSEPEARAMARFTRQVEPRVTLSFHSSGQTIYYPQDVPYPELARELGALTGYEEQPLDDPAGGFTDWVVHEFQRPAFTLELGPFVGPKNLLPRQLVPEWRRVRLTGLLMARRAAEII